MQLNEIHKQRFHERTRRSGPICEKYPELGECWEWTAGLASTGYGMLKIVGREDYTHRIAWFLAHGEIEKGMCVCHYCDNRLCVNPKHLWLGTLAQDLHDKILKGRVPQKDDHWNVKIPESELPNIRALRAQGWSQTRIANHYGVGQGAHLSYFIWRKQRD